VPAAALPNQKRAAGGTAGATTVPVIVHIRGLSCGALARV